MAESGSGEHCTITVDDDGVGCRVDLYLSERLEGVSRSRLQRLIRNGEVLVDGRPCKASTPLKENQVVSWPADAGLAEIQITPQPIPFEVLFEDADILVIQKPAGLVVHPAPGHWEGTLVHGLIHRWPDWAAPGGALRPGIVHRLDKETSGLMVVARSPRAYDSLREQFSEHSSERLYVALVWGAMPTATGEITRPIGRDPRHRQRMATLEEGGRPAHTYWEVRARFDSLTLLRIGLHTGRTHQVRVHLASAGHPVFGDALYGGVKYVARLAPRDRPWAHGLLRQLGRFALHAYHLAFRHPADGEWLVFEAPVPEDMEKVLLQLTNQEERNEGFEAH